jgi:hypothetical protein
MAGEQVVTESAELKEALEESCDGGFLVPLERQFDLNKHLTTLSAGTIVMLAAFVDKPTTMMAWDARIFLILSFLAMIVALILGSYGMFAFVGVHRSQFYSEWFAKRLFYQIEKTIPEWIKNIEQLEKQRADSAIADATERLAKLRKEGLEHEHGAMKSRENMKSARDSIDYLLRVERICAVNGMTAFVFGLVVLCIFTCWPR